MENTSSPAALAARIAEREADLAASVAHLTAELSPASLAARAERSVRSEAHRLVHDDSGRLSTPFLATLVGAVALAVGLIVVRVVRK
ncbi:MAG: hypothetical protein LBJ08_02420 [Bifidobacteriaceae bacterium]|jgi:hypothetical protein|nr:hypothetical protein [Bifidobacteriaceae bacterium]